MIHHIYANRTNIGDWLSARGIQSLLGSPSLVEHFCDEPFIEETIEAISACDLGDLVIIGGGGLFMDYFVPFWESFRNISKPLRYIIWGIGYCDLKREPSRPPVKLLQEIVHRSSLCYVRDDLTREYLAGCQLPKPVVCPSVAVLRESPRSGFGILHVDNYTTAGADVFEAMQASAEAYARTTGRILRRTNNRLNPAGEGSLAAALSLYEQSDVVLSSALHGCLIAAAMGKKVLAVSGDRKIEASMSALGLGEWVLDYSEVDQVPKRLMELEQQTVPVQQLQMARRENQQIAAEILRLSTSHDKAPGAPTNR